MFQIFSSGVSGESAKTRSLFIGGLRLYRSGALLIDCLEFESDSQRICISGPNGSGKTTLLLALAGLIQVAAGEVRVQGVTRPAERRKACGVFSSSIEIPPYLSVVQAIGLYNDKEGQLSRFEDQFLRELDMESGISVLSEGQKRKVGIVCALRKERGVLLLDEPFNALDVASSDLLREYLKNYTGLLVYVDHRRLLAGVDEARIAL